MTLVSKKDYTDELKEFKKRHHFKVIKVTEKPLLGKIIRKVYYYSDGSTWYENRYTSTESTEFAIFGQFTKVVVHHTELEYFSSDDCESKFCYFGEIEPFTECKSTWCGATRDEWAELYNSASNVDDFVVDEAIAFYKQSPSCPF